MSVVAILFRIFLYYMYLNWKSPKQWVGVELLQENQRFQILGIPGIWIIFKKGNWNSIFKEKLIDFNTKLFQSKTWPLIKDNIISPILELKNENNQRFSLILMVIFYNWSIYINKKLLRKCASYDNALVDF